MKQLHINEKLKLHHTDDLIFVVVSIVIFTQINPIANIIITYF